VFAQRYNRDEGRIGHIWGDRYWSRIVEDAEAEGAEGAEGRARYGEADAGVRPQCGERAIVVRPRHGERAIGVRPRRGETTLQKLFPLKFPLLAAPTPG
jgi:hypothetical protein